MRHAKLVPAVMAMGMLFLSGCTLSVYNSYRDIENLDVVQVIGLDAVDGGGVRFSVATGPDSSGREPVRLTQDCGQWSSYQARAACFTPAREP